MVTTAESFPENSAQASVDQSVAALGPLDVGVSYNTESGAYDDSCLIPHSFIHS
jgi:hypothetical protein